MLHCFMACSTIFCTRHCDMNQAYPPPYPKYLFIVFPFPSVCTPSSD